MNEPFAHESVLVSETVAALAPRAGGVYADVTLGGGGHAEAILEASAPDGRVVGVDRDEEAVAAASARLRRFGARAEIVHGEMRDVGAILARLGVALVDGIVADLGVSSPQLDRAERGFSFVHAGPLDMRMDPSRGETALALIRRLSERELADLIYTLGEERKSRRIARSIREALVDGALETTEDLRRAVVRAVGGARGRLDPATRTFQALRIAVNDELGQLAALLAALPELLADHGVAVVIAFHSLEDRMVKHAFRDDARLHPATRKPVVAGEEEAARNRRARSAKLRAARRVPRSLCA